MPSIKARAEVIGEFGAEFGRYCLILDKVGVLPVSIVGGKRGGSDMFGYPLGVARSAIEGGSGGQCWIEIGDRAWEAVLEEAVGINRRKDVLEACWIVWNGHCGSRCRPFSSRLLL